MRSETGTIINNNYPGELITFLNLNLPPAFKGAVGDLLLLFLSTCSHLKKFKLIAIFYNQNFPTFLEDKCTKLVFLFYLVIKPTKICW